ncbi:MAG: hypothetical protein R3Y35_11445 [Clostridia bacterium]
MSNLTIKSITDGKKIYEFQKGVNVIYGQDSNDLIRKLDYMFGGKNSYPHVKMVLTHNNEDITIIRVDDYVQIDKKEYSLDAYEKFLLTLLDVNQDDEMSIRDFMKFSILNSDDIKNNPFSNINMKTLQMMMSDKSFEHEIDTFLNAKIKKMEMEYDNLKSCDSLAIQNAQKLEELYLSAESFTILRNNYISDLERIEFIEECSNEMTDAIEKEKLRIFKMLKELEMVEEYVSNKINAMEDVPELDEAIHLYQESVKKETIGEMITDLKNTPLIEKIDLSELQNNVKKAARYCGISDELNLENLQIKNTNSIELANMLTAIELMKCSVNHSGILIIEANEMIKAEQKETFYNYAIENCYESQLILTTNSKPLYNVNAIQA